jgi:hypothetical protein
MPRPRHQHRERKRESVDVYGQNVGARLGVSAYDPENPGYNRGRLLCSLSSLWYDRSSTLISGASLSPRNPRRWVWRKSLKTMHVEMTRVACAKYCFVHLGKKNPQLYYKCANGTHLPLTPPGPSATIQPAPRKQAAETTQGCKDSSVASRRFSLLERMSREARHRCRESA